MSSNVNKLKYLVVTDLDGTLLDHFDYGWQAAQPALDFLREQKIPVVINTSKTANEVLTLQNDIGLQAAFIVENGSAIFIPEGESHESLPELERIGDHWRKLMGEERTVIVNKLQALRAQYAWKFEGFSDWSVEQIVDATGLSMAAATEASQRQFSEPIVWLDSEANYLLFCEHIDKLGLKVLRGGRFIHILGNTDKGRAALWLKNFYVQQFKAQYRLVVLGDGPNDVDMLTASDIAVVVKSPAHDFPKIERKEAMIFTKAYGPEGWNEAINNLKSEII